MKHDLPSYLLIAAVLALGGLIVWLAVLYIQSQPQPWIDATIRGTVSP